MRRLHATLADYVIVAINPALIMVLIGSLVYFLLEMFYQGQYPGRLHYCMTLYIFAAVLVSRISMEEGWDHAAPFGGALIVVIVLALHRFVDYAGTNLAAVGWLINYVLIGLIAWCAHRLTWDCTLIDESQDASGEGLLQTVGFDANEKKEGPTTKAEISQKPKPSKAADETLPAIAVNDSESTATARASGKSAKKSWWQQFVERRRRPHAPGVWIVYFSLAALPLFGLGQAFIPASNTSSRRYAFVLLCIYVACGLGLLLTTSFLGLRRYLRQRKLEMPAAMTGTWLTTGAVLIVVLLIFTALLPRPNAEYAISQLPKIGATHRDSSRVSTGKEGTKDDQANSAPGKDGRPDEQKEQDPKANQNGTERDPENTGKGAGGQNETRKDGDSSKSQEGETQDNSSSSSSELQGNESKGADSKSDSSTEQNSADGKAKSEEKSNSSNTSDSKQEQSTEGGKQSEEQKAQSEENQQSGSGSQPPESNPQPPEIQPPDITALGGSFFEFLKWLFYGVVIAAAVWWLVRNWALVLAWLQSLLTMWQSLFSRRRELPETIQIAPIRRSFSEYSDPFATGMAGRFPPEELVRYSFEAFEAWARDQGWPRDDDQTAYEFARAVGSQAAHISASARTLADLYSWAAYFPGKRPPDAVEQLRPLWKAMTVPQLVS